MITWGRLLRDSPGERPANMAQYDRNPALMMVQLLKLQQ